MMSANLKMRWRLLKGQRGRCFYCREDMVLQSGERNSVTVDHVIPLSRGGSNKEENKVGACWTCNQAKRDMDINEYADILERNELKARDPQRKNRPNS